MAADETKTGTEGTEAEPKPQEGAQGGAEANPEPEAEGQGAGGSEVEDKHGQPGINREKYQRDMKERDDKIAELQAKLDEKAKTEEGRDELKKQIEDLKAEVADERLTHKLELAGCRNVKAAKSVLDDYDGDVAKLKEDCPYLFDGRKAGSTGLKSEGDAGKALDSKLDKIFGVKED